MVDIGCGEVSVLIYVDSDPYYGFGMNINCRYSPSGEAWTHYVDVAGVVEQGVYIPGNADRISAVISVCAWAGRDDLLITIDDDAACVSWVHPIKGDGFVYSTGTILDELVF